MLPVQCKMARVALGLGVRELAKLADVSTDTIARFERGEELKDRTLAAVRSALESAGVEFIAENGGGAGVRLRRKQMDDEPIYVDASRSAVLNHGASSINCPTLQEAVLEFERLPRERQEVATITSLGTTYSASEIRRLHYGPKLSSKA